MLTEAQEAAFLRGIENQKVKNSTIGVRNYGKDSFAFDDAELYADGAALHQRFLDCRVFAIVHPDGRVEIEKGEELLNHPELFGLPAKPPELWWQRKAIADRERHEALIALRKSVKGWTA